MTLNIQVALDFSVPQLASPGVLHPELCGCACAAAALWALATAMALLRVV